MSELLKGADGFKATGGPAFPQSGATDGDGDIFESDRMGGGGMTLRDYLAAKAMQGDWACQSDRVGNDIDIELIKKRAEVYYCMADAMLAARASNT
ncbi:MULTISPECIES: hypothetical protein [unclassified Pantoea]|uniref:hypothetical protein n=1 Tax=unclassified Pantoea TaxID=2630326 RepID=UPI001CD3C26C|nr:MULTISPECIES: hypothetical protein [unclassified Pantoea]MCA1178910.1 hypothetical protein [Pantoea sp. alder69]MCA1253777.1 hypothetical protein [Pantoea sp. alder70]MCA1267399.1 hypothetical protein [Pantoea sp. alder81]